MDISFPHSISVNDMVLSGKCMGSCMNLHYPSVDNLVELVKLRGKGCALFKWELLRVFHWFPIDAGDYNLLGFTWRGIM